MSSFNWERFLRRWSQELLASMGNERDTLPQDVIHSGWLGYGGATEEQIASAEARLGTSLPPSYRKFLTVSNGWRQTTPFIYKLWSVAEIEWFATRHQDWINTFTMFYQENHQETSTISDQEYFVYGDDQDCSKIRVEYLQTALEVSERGESAIYLLNPQVIATSGEWEAWFFGDWLPGADRYQSFRDMMEAEYENFLEQQDTSPSQVFPLRNPNVNSRLHPTVAKPVPDADRVRSSPEASIADAEPPETTADAHMAEVSPEASIADAEPPETTSDVDTAEVDTAEPSPEGPLAGAEPSDTSPSSDSIPGGGTVEAAWRSLARFAMQIQVTPGEPQPSYQTRVCHLEKNAIATWVNLEQAPIWQWILEQVQSPMQAEVAQSTGAVASTATVASDDREALETLAVAIQIIQIRALQLHQPQTTIQPHYSSQALPTSVKSSEPLSLEITLKLAELVPHSLLRRSLTCLAQGYARNLQTGAVTHLGDSQSDAIWGDEPTCVTQLPATKLLPGMYRLQFLATLSGAIATPGYLEIPFLQVV